MVEPYKRPEDISPPAGSRSIDLYANSYRLNFTKSMFQYSVQFVPELDTHKEKRLREVLMSKVISDLAPLICIFDNTILYTFEKEAPTTEFVKQRKSKGETIEYKINLSLTNTLAPATIVDNLQWLNVFLRSVQRDSGLIEIRRNMVDPAQSIQIPHANIQLLGGTKFVIYRTISGINFTADKVFSVVQTEPLLALYDRTSKEEFIREVKNSFIVTIHTPKKLSYRVIDVLSDKFPETTKFRRAVVKSKPSEGASDEKEKEKEEGKEGEADVEFQEETISEYYQDRYRIRLVPQRPLLVCRPTGRGTTRLDLIPLDVAFATGIPKMVQSNFTLMKEIKGKYQSDPRSRFHQINQITDSFFHTPKLAQAGLTRADDSMIKIKGAALEPARLRWGKATIRPERGEFRDATRNNELYRPRRLNDWLVVCTERDSKLIDNLCRGLSKVSNNGIDRPQTLLLRSGRPQEFYQEMEDRFRSSYSDLQIVVIILPKKEVALYKAVKRLTSLRTPVPSQCVTAQKLMSPNLSVMTGIWTQIVQKIGGICWELEKPDFAHPPPPDHPAYNKQDDGIMCVGIDISATSATKEGVVALTASYNHSLNQFHQRTMKVPAKTFLVADKFTLFMKLALKQYRSYNRNKLPSYIFIFRQGLNENQFEEALKVEYLQFVDACKEFDEPSSNFRYRPSHSYIAVEKKTHHRFFARNSDDSIANPPPGTLIDSGVVSEKYYDFFLVAQNVINAQTSALPTRYVILANRGNVKPPQIEDFVYGLCHLYCNYFGAISAPLPIQMARKLSSFSYDILDCEDIKSSMVNVSFQI